jgi:hypothetical protein
VDALIQDIFPARVILAGGEILAGARVLLTESRAYCFLEDRSGVHLAHSGEVALYQLGQGVNAPTVISFTDGTSWSALRAGGCGCGSKLKVMDPQAALAQVSV